MNNHQAIRDHVRPGDILLSRKKGSPVSEIIRGVTRSRWSHSFLYIGEGKIIESDWDGVVINPLEYYLNTRYDVGLFRAKPELTKEEEEQLVLVAREMLGIKYGYLQLLWFLILRIFGKSEDPDWSLDVDKGVVCSEMMAAAYEKIGKRIKELPPHQIEPADFDESPITVRIA